MEIVAHRGASYIAPENTLASIRLAWELGADAAEVDVHLTGDGRIAVIHDETTLRTSGKDLAVARSVAETLRALDVGSFKDKKYSGEKIPFLDEILATIPKNKKLLVEVKGGTEILPSLKTAFEDSGKTGLVIVISFRFEVVAASKELMPAVPAFWLLKAGRDPKTDAPVPHDAALAKKAIRAGIDGLGAQYTGVTESFAREVLKTRLKLYVWTVDDETEASRLKALGVHGLITNRPDWIRGQLEQ